MWHPLCGKRAWGALSHVSPAYSPPSRIHQQSHLSWIPVPQTGFQGLPLPCPIAPYLSFATSILQRPDSIVDQRPHRYRSVTPGIAG